MATAAVLLPKTGAMSVLHQFDPEEGSAVEQVKQGVGTEGSDLLSVSQWKTQWILPPPQAMASRGLRF